MVHEQARLALLLVSMIITGCLILLVLCQAKAWTAIDRLLVIWKSDLIVKIKCFFPSSGHVSTAVWMQYMYREKARQQLHKNAVSNIEQVLAEASHKAAAVQPLTTHHENYPS